MPPETIATLLGIFQPNNPMVKAMADKVRNDNGSGGNSSDILNGERHTDSETQQLIESVYELLVNEQNVGVVGSIAALVDYFVKHHDHLALTVQKFFPGEKTKKSSITDANIIDPEDDED